MEWHVKTFCAQGTFIISHPQEELFSHTRDFLEMVSLPAGGVFSLLSPKKRPEVFKNAF